MSLARDLSRGLIVRMVGKEMEVGMWDGGNKENEEATQADAGERQEDIQSGSAVGSPRGPRSIVFGSSPRMSQLLRFIEHAARVDSKVLLLGETGTGKGVVAREIHRRSARGSRDFIHVDCGALSPTLIESELFGHEKGSFTGAAMMRKGRFELAELGTIFLDEIGDLHPALQAKLLRVLEDSTYERVGGTRSLPMKARVISATSRDLSEAVQSGRFRQDLFFRLNVVSFRVPPLRERPEDIPELVGASILRLSESLRVPTPSPTNEFCERLMQYSWPGNVRELLNLLERLLVQRRGTLDAVDLEGELSNASCPSERHVTRMTDREDEALLIATCLVDTGGVVARAARRLGIPRSSLRYKIKRYNLGHLIPHD